MYFWGVVGTIRVTQRENTMLLTNRHCPTHFEIKKLYTLKASADILSIREKDIFDVVIVEDGAIVTWITSFEDGTTHCNSVYVLKEQYEDYFRESRKERASNVRVQSWEDEPGVYTTYTYGKMSRHVVTLTDSSAGCSCEDFGYQAKSGRKTECKHIYASLNTLGFEDLESYFLKVEEIKVEEAYQAYLERRDYLAG